MAISECKVIVRRRSPLALGMRLPLLFWRHYQIFRRDGVGRIIAAYGAWLSTSVVFNWKR